MWTRRKLWGAVAAAIVAGALWLAWPTLSATAALLDLAGQDGLTRRLIPVGRAEVSIDALEIPTRHGPVAARLYVPSPPVGRTVVVIPGIHGAGIDEPRLVQFSRRLAATGVNVLSVPLPDLRRYRITGRSTDVIEDATVWAAASPRLAPRGRVGLIGVSFSGGLTVAAAGRPSLAGRLDAVVSLGGHGDLERVLRYLCTGILPDGTTRTPHDYGVAIAALAAVEWLVPREQAPQLERAILSYLEASVDESPEQQQALALLADARRQAANMDEPARSIMTWVNNRNVAALGRAVEPFITGLARDPALSPERSPLTQAPVFLLQGHEDNVIPPSETPRLASYLSAKGHRQVRWLLTPALSHMGVQQNAGVVDWWRVVRFWQALSATLDR